MKRARRLSPFARFAPLALVALGSGACFGFGDYKTRATGTGGAATSSVSTSSSMSTSTMSTSTMSTSTMSSSTMSSMTSSSTGAGGCPMPGQGATEDCWTPEAESAQGNLACVTLDGVASHRTVKSESDASAVYVQRLRVLGDGNAYAIGSSARGLAFTHRSVVARLPALDVKINEPETDSTSSNMAEAYDFAGGGGGGVGGSDVSAGYLVGHAAGISAELGDDSTVPHFYVTHFNGLNGPDGVKKALEPAMPDHTGTSRALAVVSTDADADLTTSTTAFGLIEAESGAKTCADQSGILAARWTWASNAVSECTPIGDPCAGSADTLVPGDMLLSDDGMGGKVAIAVGQVCSGSLVSGSAPTGFVVRIQDGQPPVLGPSAVVAPMGSGTAEVRAIRAVGDHFVIGGTFTGAVNFGSTMLTSAGASDGFVAVLDKNLAFVHAIGLGGVGADTITDLTVVPRTGHPDVFGVFLVGSFKGSTSFGCFGADAKGDTRAYLAEVLLPGLDAAATPEILFFTPLSTLGSSRADRVLADKGSLYISGELEIGAALEIGGTAVPASPVPAKSTFLVTLATHDSVMP